MRLGIIGSRGYPSTYSGYETLIRELAPALAARGHDVTVYGRDAAAGTVIRDGVRVVNLRALETKSLSTISHAGVSARHARAEQFDCILGVNLATTVFLEWLANKGTPCALNVDGLEWTRGKWGLGGKAVFRASARLAAAGRLELIADSQRIADYYAMQFRAPSHFIPYGAQVIRTAAEDRIESLGLEPGGYLLVVARIVPENSIDLILDGHAKSATDLPLVVVGSANYRSPLERRLSTLNESGSIRWLGHVHDGVLLEQLWTHCALYIHGHSVGGTNPSLLQALGCGAPTLPLGTPFNREVVGADGASAPCFEPDSDTLALMIERAVHGDLDVIAGEAARAIVERWYSWDSVVERYANLFEEIVGSHPAGVGSGDSQSSS